MRIALLTDLPSFCSGQSYLNELKTGLLKDAGIESDVYLIGARRLSSLEAKIPFRRTLSTLRSARDAGHYDLVHVQFTFPLGFARTVIRALGISRTPILIHTHGYDVFARPGIGYGMRRSPVGRWLTGLTWRSASSIIAVCQTSAKSIVETGVPPTRVHLLYNGVDTARFRPSAHPERKPGNPDDAPQLTFLCVAGLVPVKNHKTLLSAFNRFVLRHKNCRLALVGDGPLRDSLKKIANPNVLFLGHVPSSEMPRMYLAADAFILSSFSEAHPWSLLEAMSSGLPVIASRVGGIPETIASDEFTFDPNKADDILSRMEQLTSMTNIERCAIGDRNRSIVVEKFSFPKHVERLKSIYSLCV